MAPNAHAEDKMIQLTGCVRGFAQGGYFFSDVVTEKGKVKHMVKVEGTPAPFGWSVKFTTADNRTLKTSDVFGVDTVEVVQPTCTVDSPGATVARR